MLSALCRSGKLQEARQLAKEFEAKYAKYDLVMSNTLLRVYCNARDMDSAMQMLKKMDELTISPDWNTFHILIKYFCRERLYHLAYRTIEDMHRKGHQLDEVKFPQLLSYVLSPTKSLLAEHVIFTHLTLVNITCFLFSLYVT